MGRRDGPGERHEQAQPLANTSDGHPDLADLNGAVHADQDGPAPRWMVQGAGSSIDQGLLIVPPLVIVKADVSWQLAGMLRWARLVLA
jgi:hypothetical protein